MVSNFEFSSSLFLYKIHFQEINVIELFLSLSFFFFSVTFSNCNHTENELNLKCLLNKQLYSVRMEKKKYDSSSSYNSKLPTSGLGVRTTYRPPFTSPPRLVIPNSLQPAPLPSAPVLGNVGAAVTLEEVREAMDIINSFAAPGPDGFQASFYKMFLGYCWEFGVIN